MPRRSPLQILLRLTLVLAIVFNGLWSSGSMASMAIQQASPAKAVAAATHAGCHTMAHPAASGKTSAKSIHHGDCGRGCCKGSVCDCGCTTPLAVIRLDLPLLSRLRPLGPPTVVADASGTIAEQPSLRPPIV